MEVAEKAKATVECTGFARVGLVATGRSVWRPRSCREPIQRLWAQTLAVVEPGFVAQQLFRDVNPFLKVFKDLLPVAVHPASDQKSERICRYRMTTFRTGFYSLGSVESQLDVQLIKGN